MESDSLHQLAGLPRTRTGLHGKCVLMVTLVGPMTVQERPGWDRATLQPWGSDGDSCLTCYCLCYRRAAGITQVPASGKLQWESHCHSGKLPVQVQQ